MTSVQEKQGDAAILVENITGPMHGQALELAENVLFMADRLKETRRKAARMDLVIPYDNGGGQTGVRKNPIFEAYAQIFAQYSKGLGQLTEMVEAAGGAKPQAATKLAELRLVTGNIGKAREA